MFRIDRNMRIDHNVRFNILDRATGTLVRSYEGHNQATNSMLTGIAHYLCGDGVLNQGFDMLSSLLPRYISLGTMGLMNQDEDEEHLPAGISGYGEEPQGEEETAEAYETRRFRSYMQQMPSYGADGYYTNTSMNNGRPYLGLGPAFQYRETTSVIDCELVSPTFPRAQISYRSITPEDRSETPETIDIIYSAMISTGALAQFREPDKDYIFITEAGLWSTPVYSSDPSESPQTIGRGLLAGYRIAPPSENDWDMSIPANRQLLKSQVIRVGINQVVQVIWKIQIGSMSQLTSRIYDTSIYIGKGET